MHNPISSGATFSVNKGLLYIDCDELHDIEIFDISGSKVLETIMQSQFAEFDLNFLDSGIYILVLSARNE